MFTGLIEDVGTLFSVVKRSDVLLLEISGTRLASGVRKGDSVAVSGACLSVVAIPSQDRFAAELMAETANRTTLGTLPAGSKVNLERALPVSGRFEGHIVTGHVDARGRVLERRQEDRTAMIRIGLSADYLKYVAAKGSVAVDGVSLTVIDSGPDWFSAGIIPTTIASTTLMNTRRGDDVNIECDILAKYLEKLAFGKAPPRSGSKEPGLDWEDLRKMGWES